jgi:GNAT superfamily N-acetyltransferase
VKVHDVGPEAAHQLDESPGPPRVGQPAPSGHAVHAGSGLFELGDEVCLVGKDVRDVHLDVRAPRTRQPDQQALGTAWAQALDHVEDAHALTIAGRLDRYRYAVSDLAIRRYEDTDEDAVLSLLAASLGKTVDARYREYFRWKHLQNPFGRSFMWVGEAQGRIVGFRAFLRWRFMDPGGEPVEAVRAVDTATHPDAQGLGIFRTLTLHGIDEMRPANIQFVFNTPNDQSRPGYLKMGWEVAGRVPVQVRPRSLAALWRIARARTAAEPWSQAVEIGEPVSAIRGLVSAAPRPSVPGSLTTDRTESFIAWRYGGCAPVASRAVDAGSGAVLVRFRIRGPAMECVVGDLVGASDARQAGQAVRRSMRSGGADYAIAATTSAVGGMVRFNRLGPIQTRRSVSSSPTRLPLALSLGDVELF